MPFKSFYGAIGATKGSIEMNKPKRKRTPAHCVNKRQKALAIKALTSIVESPDAATYVVAKAAAALLNNGKDAPESDVPLLDPDAPRTVIFLPRRDRHPGQRDDESGVEWSDRIKAKVEGRRAAYCEHIGEAYDSMRPLPCWPWPVPGSNPELEAEADRMADEEEAAEIERPRAHPRPALVEVLGPREDAPGVVIYDSRTPDGLADYRRLRAEAEAAGHKIVEPQ
jgi:hypothetical protein